MTAFVDLPPIVQRFGIRVIADILGVTPSAISQWHTVPLGRVVILANALQVTPAEIRPDLFAPGATIEEAAQYQLAHDPRTRARATQSFRQKFKGEMVTIRRVEWQELQTLARAIRHQDSTPKSLRHHDRKSQKTVCGTNGE
ncbi:helix-turn-helix domain-containing protein [Acidithiobacillus ferrooxidans]|nr:helix-turn-helix domain-containing protein [Acidithiobacillus ferrooxidans]